MDTYFKPTRIADAKQMLEQKQFNIDDVRKIAKWLPEPLEKEFDPPLTETERDIVCTLVCRNIWKICQVYSVALKDNGENDYLIKKTYLDAIKEQAGNDLSKIIPLKADYFLANGYNNGQVGYIFEGKIPKRGFFGSRQTIANKWINDYTNHLGFRIVMQVLSKTNINRELAMVAIAENTACFLAYYYPKVFNNNSTVYDINIELSKL